MVAKSRADYFKKRRETLKQFNVALDKILIEKFEEKLKQMNKTKKSWIEEKISEELQK